MLIGQILLHEEVSGNFIFWFLGPFPVILDVSLSQGWVNMVQSHRVVVIIIIIPALEAAMSGWCSQVASSVSFPSSHPSGHLFLPPLPLQKCFFHSIFPLEIVSSLFQVSESLCDRLIGRERLQKWGLGRN